MTWKQDPARRAMPFEEWPEPDQRAWEVAMAGGDVFEERGRGARWAAATKDTDQRLYGRWLGYLAYIGELTDIRSLADRVTRETVRRYNAHLIGLGTVAPRTRLSMLVGLKEVIRAMAPDRDWRWFQDMCNRIQRNADPSRDKRQRVRSSGEIYAAALAGLAAQPQEPQMLRHLVDYRDHLMLALLAARPLRKKNFTWLELDRHVIRVEDRWLIAIPGKETKTGQPQEFWMPDDLVPWFEHYLTDVRPRFPGADATAQLWVSKDGPRLGNQFLYWRITKLTERLSGAPLNPHLLRDCAATTLALESPDLAQTASPLLGHRHVSTTSRNYVQAKNLEASRRMNAILSAIKAELETVE